MDKVTTIDTPVAYITYIRLDTTMQTFERIRNARPFKLYYISDAGKDAEGQRRVEEVRRYVEEHIDWPCEVHKNYATFNMGAGKRIQSGLDWVFESEDRAIVIEDDVLVANTFFLFAQEMLEKYKDEPKVHAVTSNRREPDYKFQHSYSFSRFSSIWGWATWKRAWDGHEAYMERWDEIRRDKLLVREYGIGLAMFYEREIESVRRNENDAWDIQWFLSRAATGSLEVVPEVNLATNIGNISSADATHKPVRMKELGQKEIEFPLVEEPVISANVEFDQLILKRRYHVGIAERVIRGVVPASWLRAVRLFFERRKKEKKNVE